MTWRVTSFCVHGFEDADRRQAEALMRTIDGARAGWLLSNPPGLVVVGVETEVVARALAEGLSEIPHIGVPRVDREIEQPPPSRAPGPTTNTAQP